MSKKLRVGVIGLGIGQAHLQAYATLAQQCEIVAVCDFDSSKTAAMKALYPTIRIESQDALELTNSLELDLISICSNDDHHHQHTCAALRAGKHVFVEKPLCLQIEELEEIKQLLADNPTLKISSNLILRYSPRFIELRQLIKSNQLGDLFLIEGDYNYGRFDKIVNSWRGKIKDYSGVLGGGIHLIDLFLWLSSDKIVEVRAMGSNKAAKQKGSNVIDTSMAILRFESGMLGKLSVNLACTYPHFHRFSVYGTKATFENGQKHASLFRSALDGSEPEKLNSSYPDVHKGALLSDFVSAIQNDRSPAVSWSELEECLRVCFAIDQSIRTGEAVKV